MLELLWIQIWNRSYFILRDDNILSSGVKIDRL